MMAHHGKLGEHLWGTFFLEISQGVSCGQQARDRNRELGCKKKAGSPVHPSKLHIHHVGVSINGGTPLYHMFEKNTLWRRQLSLGKYSNLKNVHLWVLRQWSVVRTSNDIQWYTVMHAALFWKGIVVLEESVVCAASLWCEWDIWINEYIIVG